MSDKRKDIITATLKLITEKGFGGVSTDTIAKEANVGKGTIYKYFESKEVLYSTLFDELCLKFLQTILSNYNFKLDPAANFKHIVFVLVHYYVEHEDEFRYLERYSDVNLNIDKRLYESTKLIDPIKTMLNGIDHGIKFKPLPPLIIFAMTYGPLVAVVNLVLLKKIELTDNLIFQIADSCWDSILEK
jgi:AcrR family transcriptional regulator